MTNEDIIRMAREAGCLGPGKGGDPNGLWEPNGEENVTELMFRFAALVAAAEREACAQVCMEIEQSKPLSDRVGWEHGTVDCQVAIRARSKA